MSGRSPVDRLFEELEVECGASVHCITQRVSALLRVDIEVEVLTEEEWNAVPQFVLVEGDRARIPVRGTDPRWYRLHVVIHELAHLLCGHSRCEALPMTFERLRKPAQACVLVDASAGTGAGATAHDVCQEQADQEAEAHALAHRLGAYVLVPQLASADAIRS